MPVFTNLKGVAAPLDIQNVDTDMIIPKEYLKTIKRNGCPPSEQKHTQLGGFLDPPPKKKKKQSSL